MTIYQVYEKYKHLDRLFSDEAWLDTRKPQTQALYDMWQAIRSTNIKMFGEVKEEDRPPAESKSGAGTSHNKTAARNSEKIDMVEFATSCVLGPKK